MTDERPPKPHALSVEPDGIPTALREDGAWLVWRYVWQEDREQWAKVPYHADGEHRVDATDPANGVDFPVALATYKRGTYDGLGVITDPDDPHLVFDLDDVVDPERRHESLPDLVREIVEELDTYTEYSPSQTGYHVWVEGEKPGEACRSDLPIDPVVEGETPHLELYDGSSGRYITVTGQHVCGTPETVEPRHEVTRSLYDEYLGAADAPDGPIDQPTPGRDNSLDDEDLLERAKAASNGEKFERLWNGGTAGYPSQSEADLALCGLLAFWTGGDREQMDRLFRQSGLYREKWDEQRGDRTYGQQTIVKTLQGNTEFYEPRDGSTGSPVSGPADHVSEPLLDAIREAPTDWIDPDAQAWSVRATEDFGASEIASAVRKGELPGDADDAIASAVMAGNFPDEIGAAFTAWNRKPDEWDVEVARYFDPGALDPGAIAADADVDPENLGGLPARELAHHVWTRVRRRDDVHVVARVGERGDGSLFSHDPDTGTWSETGAPKLRTIANEALGSAYSRCVGDELEERVRTTRAIDEPNGQVDVDEFGAPVESLPVANGLLEIGGRELGPLEPTDYALATLPITYDPDADCPTFEAFLEEVCPRSVDRQKLQEFVGYALMHWALPYHKALFVAGPQASGKSTFLDVVRRLLGPETTCSLAPQEITSERFAGYDLWGAWANIRSDIPAELIQNTGKFKEVTAGDPIKVEQKHKDPITIEPTAKHFFAANTLPSAEIDDDAFFRRILMVSFPRTVPRSERDPHLIDALADELPGILNWALDGLDRLRDQGHFSGDLPPAETHEKWQTWGESIQRFLHQCVDTDVAATATVPKGDLYDAYVRFCEEEGIPAESKQKFGREIMGKPGVGEKNARKDGRRVRVYTGIELDERRVTAEREGDQRGLGGH
ncbi:hypothetical protein L593_06040 [Salinarchaeum sp. Harcht-Bsk1]|uniref:phage/plasmid primase, P4 family n=1 Tax=Salinarchaeum sp. Harcht-Bsk1 TaxID=1333523 RepID=UPI00034244DF|nr:phage/plasmid primase, P4 family [Salinarchaeum sp. Harcht-Bsk1]AGN01157.1 hypothetical protein L593_06040 [Salinarchaeum sp. Harcht-Bsk1]